MQFLWIWEWLFHMKCILQYLLLSTFLWNAGCFKSTFTWFRHNNPICSQSHLCPVLVTGWLARIRMDHTPHSPPASFPCRSTPIWPPIFWWCLLMGTCLHGCSRHMIKRLVLFTITLWDQHYSQALAYIHVCLSDHDSIPALFFFTRSFFIFFYLFFALVVIVDWILWFLSFFSCHE